ncbi:methylenetetrahydrofolate reductase [Kocuria sp. M1N1S27]|uniref:methylenetetrahydrofolate reductase n=1 Tax=Kocuria kalidii TaxID=3376283 RepID=UPI0037A914FE
MNTAALVQGWSIDMIGRHLDELPPLASLLPPGSRVNVGAANGEAPDLRRITAASVAAHGLTPMPHVAARRVPSPEALHGLLAGLHQDGSSRHLLLLGGDPPAPRGPYGAALDVLRSVQLGSYGTETVGISGYPEGHPAIPPQDLWSALLTKAAVLADQGLHMELFTQFTLFADPVVNWIEAVRSAGITAPVRVGVVGPIEPARLLAYARRAGATTDVDLADRYGFFSTELPLRIGPDQLIEDLAQRLDPEAHGEVRIHLYALGGLLDTATWMQDATRWWRSV